MAAGRSGHSSFLPLIDRVPSPLNAAPGRSAYKYREIHPYDLNETDFNQKTSEDFTQYGQTQSCRTDDKPGENPGIRELTVLLQMFCLSASQRLSTEPQKHTHTHPRTPTHSAVSQSASGWIKHSEWATPTNFRENNLFLSAPFKAAWELKAPWNIWGIDQINQSRHVYKQDKAETEKLFQHFPSVHHIQTVDNEVRAHRAQREIMYENMNQCSVSVQLQVAASPSVQHAEVSLSVV